MGEYAPGHTGCHSGRGHALDEVAGNGDSGQCGLVQASDIQSEGDGIQKQLWLIAGTQTRKARLC